MKSGVIMETKNIILIAIAILVVILVAVGIYSFSGSDVEIPNVGENNTTDFIDADSVTPDVDNNTTVGDNSTFTPPSNLTNNNTPYKVYNPQTDSYVPVIGEAFDEEVNRWYTYDEDGVRYYNTRINQ